jgi:type IV pilus assembly protein PilB
MDMSPLPYRLKAAIVSRVKIMSELDIAERRIPQDGRIKVKMGNKTVDIRVSTLPTIFGEKVVMRILDPTNLMLDLTDLGFEKGALADFQTAIQKPYGIVLVTGPTGSGKTTSLYSAMTLINKPDVNIMTAEDPVEYHLEGINQVHVHPEIGLTFASALRATGHLVLSTVHTNDAPSTINRLVDMGIQPFLVSSSLNLIVAQRLVRKICPHCKQKDESTAELGKSLEQLGFSPQEAENMDTFHGSGCEQCHKTGFSGRLGIYEVLPMSAEMKELIVKEASIRELRNQMVQEHVLTLRDAAMQKLKQGITTVEEVIRETVGE